MVHHFDLASILVDAQHPESPRPEARGHRSAQLAEADH